MGAIPMYLIQMALPALVGVLLWGCTFPWRQYRLSQKGFQPAPFREGMILLFFMFMAGLFALTLTPANFWRELFIFQHFPAFPPPFQGGINLIPIRESLVQFRYYLKIGYWDQLPRKYYYVFSHRLLYRSSDGQAPLVEKHRHYFSYLTFYRSVPAIRLPGN